MLANLANPFKKAAMITIMFGNVVNFYEHNNKGREDIRKFNKDHETVLKSG